MTDRPGKLTIKQVREALKSHPGDYRTDKGQWAYYLDELIAAEKAHILPLMKQGRGFFQVTVADAQIKAEQNVQSWINEFINGGLELRPQDVFQYRHRTKVWAICEALKEVDSESRTIWELARAKSIARDQEAQARADGQQPLLLPEE